MLRELGDDWGLGGRVIDHGVLPYVKNCRMERLRLIAH